MAVLPSNVTNGDFKKADAFINLSLPRTDGSKCKLGDTGIKLYVDKADHIALINMFQDNPESAVELFRKHLIIDYREANVAPAALAFGE